MGHKFESKEAATSFAEKMVNMMETSGWQIRVHQNAGWYCSIFRGNMSVGCASIAPCSISPDRFYCLVGNGGTGLSQWTDPKTNYRNPNDAYEASIKCARDKIAELTRIVDCADGFHDPVAQEE